MQPSKYPPEAVFYAFRNTQVLQYLIQLFFTELLVPIYWIFRSQVKKHHRQVFSFVLQQHGLSAKKIAPISSADHQQLQMLAKQRKAEEQRAQQQHPAVSRQNPIVDWAIWLVKPPSFSSGRVEYVVKRIITAPIRSLLPFLVVLFGAANSHTAARDALSPYLEMKGIKNLDEQDVIVDKQKLMFYQFGWAALIFSCIPIVGTFFAFTNTVAAALWAIDLEKEQFNLMTDAGKRSS